MNDWSDHASCRQMNGDLFFPYPSHKVSLVRTRVCPDCPVQEECLESALSSDYEPSGVWGGRTEAQVRHMWRGRRYAAQELAEANR